MLTPKKHHKKTSSIAFVRPIQGRGIGGVLFLDDPSICPGNNMNKNHIVETMLLLVFLAYDNHLDDLTCEQSCSSLTDLCSREIG